MMLGVNLSCDTEFGFDLFDTRSTYHINQPNDHGSEGGSMSLFLKEKRHFLTLTFYKKLTRSTPIYFLLTENF